MNVIKIVGAVATVAVAAWILTRTGRDDQPRPTLKPIDFNRIHGGMHLSEHVRYVLLLGASDIALTFFDGDVRDIPKGAVFYIPVMDASQQDGIGWCEVALPPGSGEYRTVAVTITDLVENTGLKFPPTVEAHLFRMFPTR